MSSGLKGIALAMIAFCLSSCGPREAVQAGESMRAEKSDGPEVSVSVRPAGAGTRPPPATGAAQVFREEPEKPAAFDAATVIPQAPPEVSPSKGTAAKAAPANVIAPPRIKANPRQQTRRGATATKKTSRPKPEAEREVTYFPSWNTIEDQEFQEALLNWKKERGKKQKKRKGSSDDEEYDRRYREWSKRRRGGGQS